MPKGQKKNTNKRKTKTKTKLNFNQTLLTNNFTNNGQNYKSATKKRVTNQTTKKQKCKNKKQ